MSFEVEFDALCNALQGNSPSSSVVYASMYVPNGYGRRLGESLTNNTHVSFVGLELGALLLEDEPPVALQEDPIAERLTEMFRFLRNSDSLREVVLDHDIDRGDSAVVSRITDHCLQALAKNPNLQELTLGHAIQVPLHAVNDLLQTTDSLQVLDLCVRSAARFRTSTSTDAGWSANQTLQSLSFHARSDTESIESILWELSSVSSRTQLRKLSLLCGKGASSGQIKALSTLLRTTPSLSTLELAGFEFDGGLMEYFLFGLRAKAKMNSYVTLTFDHCTFTKEATCTWLCYLQTPIDVVVHNGLRSLRELHIRGYNDMFTGSCFGSVLTTGLLPMSIDKPSIGSSLSVLSLDVPQIGRFWHLYAKHASRIKLSRLDFVSRIKDDYMQLFAALPSLVHLNKLTIGKLWGGCVRATMTADDWNQVTRSLCQNGSLHRLTLSTLNSLRCACFVDGNDHAQTFFTEAEQILLTVYHQRNKVLPQILSRPLRQDYQEEGTQPHRSLFPSLFHVAKQVPRTTPNILFASLLALSELFGFEENQPQEEHVCSKTQCRPPIPNLLWNITETARPFPRMKFSLQRQLKREGLASQPNFPLTV